MALVNKNQMVGQRGNVRNEICNGGEPGCLRKYNAANVGAMWKTKKKHEGRLSWGIKSKKRGRDYGGY